MNKGFSLVELIVVIAIMAILVGVAVPVYTAYISDAKEGIEKQYVDELERAIETVLVDMEAELTDSTVTEAEGSGFSPVTSVKIAKDGKIQINGKDANNSTSVFVDLLDNIVTIRTDAAADYTFNVSGMTVTSVSGDPRV